MPITMESLKQELGDKWREGMDPVLCPHKDGGFYRAQGYEQVGEVQDSTLDQKGTLLVFDRAPQREREAANRADAAQREAKRRALAAPKPPKHGPLRRRFGASKEKK